MSEPVWQELRNDPYSGAYWLDWYCDPPAEGTAYEVTRAEDAGWRLGHPVRAIYEIRAADEEPTVVQLDEETYPPGDEGADLPEARKYLRRLAARGRTDSPPSIRFRGMHILLHTPSRPLQVQSGYGADAYGNRYRPVTTADVRRPGQAGLEDQEPLEEHGAGQEQ